MFQPTRRLLLQSLAASTALVALPRALAMPNKAWAEDADLLLRVYEAIHPGLYRYNTPDSMAAVFDRLGAEMAAAETRGSAWLALSRATAAVRCGHSQPNPYNQSDAVMAELSDGRGYLPFLFRWLGGRMIVTTALNGESRLAAGVEVVALDGETAGSLLAEMVPMARADGSNDAKRISLLELRGLDTWETFDLFLRWMRPGMAARGAVMLKLRTLDGAQSDLETGLMTRDERLAALPQRPAAKDQPWTLSEPGNGALCLTMPDWSFYNDKFDWQAKLNGDLDAISAAKPTALIVDVRANEGGNDVGDLILARLIDRDRGLARARRLTRYREIPADLNPYLDTWDDSFRNWGADAKGPDTNGFYDMTRWDEGANLLKPMGPRIDAPLFILTSPTNSSATFQFASSARALGLATLVGGPTGGNQRGINGGAFFFVRLPNSGLEADLPLIGYYPEGEWPDAGLTPDVAVEEQASDIASGRDAAMKRVVEMIPD